MWRQPPRLCRQSLPQAKSKGRSPAARVHELRGLSPSDSRLLLREAKVEAIDFLGTAIAHQERGVVGGEADPEFPRIEAARNFFQAKQAFLLTGGHTHAHEVIGAIGIILRVQVLAIMGPILETELRHGELRPIL